GRGEHFGARRRIEHAGQGHRFGDGRRRRDRLRPGGSAPLLGIARWGGRRRRGGGEDDVRRRPVGRETTVGGIAAACGVPADPGGRCGGPHPPGGGERGPVFGQGRISGTRKPVPGTGGGDGPTHTAWALIRH